MNPSSRTLRIAQAVFVLYSIVLFFLMGRLKPSVSQDTSLQFLWAISAIAVIDSIIGFFIRAAILRKSQSMDAPYKQRLKAWFSGNIVGYAFSLSTCLFAFVLHMLGAPERWAQALFGLGILMLVVQSPGTPPEQQPGPIA